MVGCARKTRFACRWYGRALPQLANTITVLRLSSVVPLVMAIMAGTGARFLDLFRCRTERRRGRPIARMTDSRSTFGSAADPVADKTLLAGALVTLWWVEAVPGWFILLLFVRDSAIVASTAALYVRTKSLKVAPLAIGKVSTALQLVLVGMILFDRAFAWPMAQLVDIGLPAVAAVALLSLVIYAVTAWRGVPLRRPSV
ncbi:MAG: CDP-alcohol phosphatidyltransferase family protein [Geminicoccaceae bacterium]